MELMVLDIEEDEKVPIILRRPFLATSRAFIDVESGELTLRVEDGKVHFNIYKNDKLQRKENEVCMRIEAIPMQGVENMKKVPKETLVESISVPSPSEEQ